MFVIAEGLRSRIEDQCVIKLNYLLNFITRVTIGKGKNLQLNFSSIKISWRRLELELSLKSLLKTR